LARGSVGPREFVRLTPVGFSVSVSIVVLLLGGAGLGGYLYGLGEAERRSAQALRTSSEVSPEPGPSLPETDDPAPVTFYTVLTERRNEAEPSSPVPDNHPEKPAKKERAVRPEREGSLSLQVASYKVRDAAKGLLENLSAEGYTGTIQVADLGERGTWYRVRIGPYKSEDDANEDLEKLRRERSLKGYIVR